MNDITLVFIVSSICGLLAYLYRESKHSRCTKISCCCIHCERDNMNLDEIEAQHQRENDQSIIPNVSDVISELPDHLKKRKDGTNT